MRIQKAKIAKHWEWVKPALEEIKAKHGPNWTVDQVYEDCKLGRAGFYIDPNTPGCFLMFRIGQNRYTGEKLFIVWIGYGGKLSVQKEYMRDIEELARFFDAPVIQISSKRKGFERTGWTKCETIYQRRVD
jgi:hypothetical protein